MVDLGCFLKKQGLGPLGVKFKKLTKNYIYFICYCSTSFLRCDCLVYQCKYSRHILYNKDVLLN
jgi:hypothetical protein